MSTPSNPVARDPVDPDVASSTTEMSVSTTAKPTPLTMTATSPSTAATALTAMNVTTEIASLILNVGNETIEGQPATGQEEIPSQIILGDSTSGTPTTSPTKSPTAKYQDFNLSSSASPYMVPITTVCLSAAVTSMITW